MSRHCCGGEIDHLVRAEPGWRAVFQTNDGVVETEPVACWALVRCNGDRHTHPIAALGGEMIDATVAGNYLGVVSPGDNPYLLAPVAESTLAVATQGPETRVV